MQEWCTVVDRAPADLDVVRYWNLAATEKTELSSIQGGPRDRAGLARQLPGADPTQCAVDAVYWRVLPRLHVEAVELDANPEVDPYLAHRITEILEGACRVRASVADQDKAAAPANHLVEPEIIEMPAIGKVDVVTDVSGAARQLVEHRQDAEERPFAAIEFGPAARIAEPPAEPDVEQHQQQAFAPENPVRTGLPAGG